MPGRRHRFVVLELACHLGDLYAESGQTLQGSFSAVSKQASKQASSFRPIHEKRKGTQANRAQLNAPDLILPVLQLQYDREWHIELVNVQYRILTLAYSQVGGVALSFTSFLWHYAEYNCNRMVQSLFMLYSIHLPISLELAPLPNFASKYSLESS